MKSKLTQEDVNNLLIKYKLSSFSALAADDVLAINPPTGHIVVYEHTLENGLLFPLSSFISSTLALLGVPPGLLLPNSVKILVGFELLCFYHDIPRRPHIFLQLFQLKIARGRFYFQPTPKSPRIYCDLLQTYQDWDDKFFFLKYDMGTYLETPLSLNTRNLGEYQLDTDYPDVHAKFQVSRVMYLSKGWDNCLVRDYLMLTKESIFTDYSWPSEKNRLQALTVWKKVFEQRSRSRNQDAIFAAKVVDKVSEERDSFEEDMAEFCQGLDIRKRCFSKDTLQGTTKEPAPRAKIQSCSNVSNYDGVLAQIPSGVVAGTPITPLGGNCFSQNLPAVGEGPPENMTLLAADMGKITSRFLSSAMGYEEKLAKLKDALDKKTAECQAWEEKFNKSKTERVLAVSKQKEYEKLLKDQKSELKLLKEQNEALDAAVNNLKVSFLDGLSNIEKARSLHKEITRAKGKRGISYLVKEVARKVCFCFL